jgi:hypothetical protein
MSSTRYRLLGGIVAGPLYLAVSYAQAAVRPGFDLSRNAFSYLSLGELGWLQRTNFVVCGLLFIVGATGMRAAMRTGPGRVWAPGLIGLMGLGLVSGGLFVVDPAFGYPAGAPDGPPAALSWHGTLHAVSFSVAMVAWLAGCFVMVRRYFAQGRRGWAAYSLVTGAVLVAPLSTVIAPPGALLIYAAATVGWTWTSAIMVELRRASAVRSRPAVADEQHRGDRHRQQDDAPDEQPEVRRVGEGARH